jgi:hypothetical protein
MIWLLPLAGVLIVLLYRLCNIREPRERSLVIEAVRTSEELPAIMAPLIFVSDDSDPTVRRLCRT